MGVLIGSAVVPIACCLSWSKCTATAAISGAWAGLAASVTCWLVYTKCTYGVITLATTGEVQTILPLSMVLACSGRPCQIRLSSRAAAASFAYPSWWTIAGGMEVASTLSAESCLTS